MIVHDLPCYKKGRLTGCSIVLEVVENLLFIILRREQFEVVPLPGVLLLELILIYFEFDLFVKGLKMRKV